MSSSSPVQPILRTPHSNERDRQPLGRKVKSSEGEEGQGTGKPLRESDCGHCRQGVKVQGASGLCACPYRGPVCVCGGEQNGELVLGLGQALEAGVCIPVSVQ